jgi:hypothetical protein
VIGAVYRRAPSNFLRAESGAYLISAHCDAQTRSAARAELVRYSWNGHYTPLAFLAEFGAARLIGTNGTLWRARQIFVLAAAVAGVFAFSCAAASRLGVPRSAAIAMSTAVAASVAFQPPMLDFISWPFMVLQLLWIGCAAVVMYALVRFGGAPSEKRWLLIAALCACGSVHISGLGLILVGACAAVLGGILLIVWRGKAGDSQRDTRVIGTVLIVMLALTLLHVWATLYLDYAPAAAAADQFSPERLALLFGFVWQFAIAGLTSFVPTLAATPNRGVFAHLWPVGVALIAGLVTAVIALWRRAAARQDDERRMTAFVLHTFSISAFCVLVLLVLVRVHTKGIAELGNELANFTWGPRYVIPLHTVLLASAAAIASSFARYAPRAGSVIFCSIALAALLAQSAFQRTAAKHLLPQTMISHDAAWALVLDTVRECRAQQLPVPDVPLGALAQEFADTTLRKVEPLLRRDLRLPASEAIEMIAWADYVAGNRERYRGVAALKRLERKLGLLPKKSR